jgi:beta-glucanase (GH16 family)
VITYYDGAEMARFPAPPQYRTPVYMLVNLTMHEKELAQATNPSVMLVDYVRAYAKK